MKNSFLKYSSAALVTGAMLVQPIAAFAAFETPAEVMNAVQMDGHARSLDFTFFLHIEPTIDAILHLNGAMEMKNGIGTTSQEAAQALKATVTGTADWMEEGKPSHVVFDMRIVNGSEYVLVRDIQSAAAQEFMDAMGIQTDGKTWIQIPFASDDEANPFQSALQEGFSNVLQESQTTDWNSIYDMQSKKYNGGTAYSLTLKKLWCDCMQNQIGQEIEGHTKIDLNQDNKFLYMKTYFKMQSPASSFTGEGHSDWMSGSVKVAVPENVVGVDQLMQQSQSNEDDVPPVMQTHQTRTKSARSVRPVRKNTSTVQTITQSTQAHSLNRIERVAATKHVSRRTLVRQTQATQAARALQRSGK